MRETLAFALALVMPQAQHLPTLLAFAPRAILTLQIARTENQREIGLMNVTLLAEHTGMLFVFPADGPVAFWMKDTLIPLDMVFVASDGTVRSIARRMPIVPSTMPDENIPLERGDAKYVIELSSGEAEQDGIVVGTIVKGLGHVAR
ncbi:MAG: DUF192 domain-containing protein [Candidatus Eremiobacteraeota bacterium]|nr:DUF192 domain-containing protein [Candidatus Eremiobacteraeota bacterium]